LLKKKWNQKVSSKLKVKMDKIDLVSNLNKGSYQDTMQVQNILHKKLPIYYHHMKILLKIQKTQSKNIKVLKNSMRKRKAKILI